MCIMAIRIDDAISNFDVRFVLSEYLLAQPGAGERPVVNKESGNWFWQTKKKDENEG